MKNYFMHKSTVQKFWSQNMPGFNEDIGKIGTAEFIQNYRKIGNFTTPFRIPISKNYLIEKT